MASFYEDNADILFHVEHSMNWEAIVPLVEQDFRDARTHANTGDAALEMAPASVADALELYRNVYQTYGQLVAEELAPHAAQMDRDGLRFQNGRVEFPAELHRFVDLLKESGVLSYALPREYGGLQMRVLATAPIIELMARADAAASITVGYFNMAEVITLFGDDAMKQEYLPKFVAGKMLGAMALTEPNYGSDLTKLTTKAIRQPDGTFHLTGTKRFITHGCGFGDDVPAAIFTVARSTDAAGARGVSFFLVETADVEVSRLEEKLGLHASPTCELVLENSKGLLIGEEGKGLVKYAIAMMNGARLAIAGQSLGIAQAALSQARKYAAERVQFGVTIENLPPVRRMLDESTARVQAARALIYRASEAVDQYEARVQALENEGVDERAIRKDLNVVKWDKLAKLLTPLSKLTASEFCCTVAYDAVQIHGGVGYTEEFEIAKIYRDARITTIYEGTSQLQVIAAIGGIVEGTGDNAVLARHIEEEIADLSDAAVRQRALNHWNGLRNSVRVLKSMRREDREATATDVVWHFVYLYTEILLARHVQIARRKSLPILAEKEQVLATYLLLANRSIQACVAQVEGVAANSVATPV